MSWTKEQYNQMQARAHARGLHLITPYRNNLKRIKVGVIATPTDQAGEKNYES
jgi:hypothetical protein